MNQADTQRDWLRELGLGGVEGAHDPNGKILFYVEVEDGVVWGGDIFSQAPGGPVRHRFSPHWLKDIAYDYWHEEAPGSRWSSLALVISDGRFTVDFVYPDQFNAEEAHHERRPRIVAAHFGNATVDYSAP